MTSLQPSGSARVPPKHWQQVHVDTFARIGALQQYIYIYIYTSARVPVTPEIMEQHIYIYRERERERERDIQKVL